MTGAPNLLLLGTDEQRADTIGNPQLQAPHLNRLAQQSAIFERAYCTQPVCTPSRATLQTGLWPHTHECVANNTPLSRSTPTLAEMIDPHFVRAYFGKWHLGDEIIAQRGFEHWCSIEDKNYRHHYSCPEYHERRSDYHHFLVRNGFPPDTAGADGFAGFSRNRAAGLAEQFTKASFLGQEAARFLDEHEGDRPFLLSVNFLEPHMPFFGPLNALHDPDALKVGPAFARPPSEQSSLRNRTLAARYAEHGQGFPLGTEENWRRLRANYYGLVTLVDRAVGKILDALERSGHAENTIVVFTSDHGDMMGDHAMLGKTVLYEESVRIPWLVRGPGIRPGLVPGGVSQIDLVPTLLDLLGQPLPDHLEGVSRAPVLRGEQTLADNDVFIEWNSARPETPPQTDPERVAAQNWRSIISTEGWKLNLCATDRSELYDLNTDPSELENLADQPLHSTRQRELTNRIRFWQQRTGDTCPIE